jgi:tetratricopeptide (TPR) repeat protein
MGAPLRGQSKQDAVSLFNEGRAFMVGGDYYGAAQAFLEFARGNPAHAESAASLAECYYYLGEYEEALVWARKARALSRGNLEVANLEAFILVAMGQLAQAEEALKAVLRVEPYNKEALFVQGEIDMARGRGGEALLRYREAAARYPDDRRLLLSLALVSLSLNDFRNAQGYIDRALTAHPDDYRVYYFAAWLDARQGRVLSAINHAESALYYRPGFAPALALLAALRYQAGDFTDAAALADRRIAANRGDVYAHYLKGLALWRLGEGAPERLAGARAALDAALSIDGNDEFVRALLEEVVLQGTGLEDRSRSRYALWHFLRAADYRRRNLLDEALFEYRRGLRLDPYAAERRNYAEALRLKGYAESYLEELLFIKELSGGAKDTGLDDAIEAYTALNRETLRVKYAIGAEEFTRLWHVSLFALDGGAQPLSAYHTDNAAVAAVYLKDMLAHDRNIDPGDGPASAARAASFAEAFRVSREKGDDYFLIVSIDENERDVLLKAALYAARTGTELTTFSAYRSGENRLRNAARSVLEQLNAALPFRASLIRRSAGTAVIDRGLTGGVSADVEYEVVKRDAAEIATGGIALKYSDAHVAGSFKAVVIEEGAAQGALTRSGFFDRIAVGDEVILQPKPEAQAKPGAAPVPPISPELQALLRLAR